MICTCQLDSIVTQGSLGVLGISRGTRTQIHLRNVFLQLHLWEEASHPKQIRTFSRKTHFCQLWPRQITFCFCCHVQIAPQEAASRKPAEPRKQDPAWRDSVQLSCLLTASRTSVSCLLAPGGSISGCLGALRYRGISKALLYQSKFHDLDSCLKAAVWP